MAKLLQVGNHLAMTGGAAQGCLTAQIAAVCLAKPVHNGSVINS